MIGKKFGIDEYGGVIKKILDRTGSEYDSVMEYLLHCAVSGSEKYAIQALISLWRYGIIEKKIVHLYSFEDDDVGIVVNIAPNES